MIDYKTFEFKTERRIMNIMQENMSSFSDDSMRKVLYAFKRLSILTKETGKSAISVSRRVFEREKSKYVAEMNWINEYMKLKGYPEDIFIDVNDFDQSSNDYDYYHGLKTKTEYQQEEAARKVMLSKRNNSSKGKSIDEH